MTSFTAAPAPLDNVLKMRGLAVETEDRLRSAAKTIGDTDPAVSGLAAIAADLCGEMEFTLGRAVRVLEALDKILLADELGPDR